MGLDMYLMRKSPDIEEMEEVGYWRKANAIHGWFDRHCPGGIENLDNVPVTEAMLNALKKDCETVLNGSQTKEAMIANGQRLVDGKWQDILEPGETIVDSSLAEEVLPTQSGFFFGSYNYDQWYLEDIKNTLEILNKVLEETDFDKEQIYYCAWW